MDVQTAPIPETAQQEPLAERSTGSWLDDFVLRASLGAVVWTLARAALPEEWLRRGIQRQVAMGTQRSGISRRPRRDPGIDFRQQQDPGRFCSCLVDRLFDQMSSADHLHVSSFNSGFPGSDLFLPPLQAMCARGQAPNVLLMTLPWTRDPRPRGIFHFIPDDHAVIDGLFPFRNFLRDLTAFLLAAPSHGGVMSYYRESEENEREVIAERGYHLITEQSHFAGGPPARRFPSRFRPSHQRDFPAMRHRQARRLANSIN